MKHYINDNSEVFAYEEDGSQDHLIGNKRLLAESEVESARQAWAESQLNKLAYAEARAMSYPPIGNQLDALWHAMNDGMLPVVPAFFDPINTIKQQFPKSV
jgi:hypothetical protein